MSSKKYYLDERITDNELRHLAQTAKDVFKNVESKLELYQKYNAALFGQSPKQASYLMAINSQSSFSRILVNFGRSALQPIVSVSPETSYQASSTPPGRNPRVSSTLRNLLSGNEASLNVTASRDKQPSSVKIQNASDREIENPKHLPVDSTDDGRIQSTISLSLSLSNPIPSAMDQTSLHPKMRIKQMTPMNAIENATEPESVPYISLPLDHKHIDSVKPVKLKASTPFRPPSMIASAQEEDTFILKSILKNTFEVNQKYANFVHETIVNPESEIRKLVETIEKYTFSGMDVKYNKKPFEVIPPVAHGEKNVSFGEFLPIANHEKNCFSPVKRVKLYHNFPSNTHESDNSENTKMLVRSDLDSKININPNRGSKVTEIFEENRKLSSLGRDTMLFKSVPRFKWYFGGLEIEFNVSWDSEKNPSSESFVSPTDYKGGRIEINNSGDKTKSPKCVRFPVNESKPGGSRDFGPSANRTTSIQAKTNRLSRDDLISLEKDHLSDEYSKGNYPTSQCVETASSPKINNLEPNTFENCKIQFHHILKLRDAFMSQFFHSMLAFQKDLKCLFGFMQNIQHIITFILTNKDFLTEELQEDIVRLTKVTSQLMEKVVRWKMDIDTEYSNWIKYSIELSKLKTVTGVFLNNNTIAPFTILLAYEENLKRIWNKIDDTILAADSSRSLFLTTADDFVQLVNLFVRILISFGILKPSPLSTLEIKQWRKWPSGKWI